MQSLWLYPVLFLTGLVAGFVDSIAGGGGLITLPVLLNLGLPPQEALGTNKLQATFGSGSAAWHFGQAGLIEWKDCLPGVLFTFLGALVGSLLIQRVNPTVLKQTIPWLLVGVALYTLFKPTFGHEDIRSRLDQKTFYLLFGLGLGLYDGFFGPGTGTFWAMAYMLCLGFNLTKATAHTKVMNFTSNVISLLVFVISNRIHYGAGLAMGLGQVVGARLGSTVVIKRGVKFIRPVFIAVVLAVTVKLLYENFSNP